MLKRPSAFLPLAMSAAALAVVLAFLAVHGVVRQPDEGAAAHLWQLLMVAQLPIIAFFALTWLPRAPRQAGAVLVLQALAICASAAPVFLLGF
jgi:cytochrome bd-type quinol oxidase subunit 2